MSHPSWSNNQFKLQLPIVSVLIQNCREYIGEYGKLRKILKFTYILFLFHRFYCQALANFYLDWFLKFNLIYGMIPAPLNTPPLYPIYNNVQCYSPMLAPRTRPWRYHSIYRRLCWTLRMTAGGVAGESGIRTLR